MGTGGRHAVCCCIVRFVVGLFERQEREGMGRNLTVCLSVCLSV